MPWGLEGDSYVCLSVDVGFTVIFSGFATTVLVVSFFGTSLTGGAGVPKMARLKARAAKTGPGVSGWSTKVSSDKKRLELAFQCISFLARCAQGSSQNYPGQEKEARLTRFQSPCSTPIQASWLAMWDFEAAVFSNNC